MALIFHCHCRVTERDQARKAGQVMRCASFSLATVIAMVFVCLCVVHIRYSHHVVCSSAQLRSHKRGDSTVFLLSTSHHFAVTQTVIILHGNATRMIPASTRQRAHKRWHEEHKEHSVAVSDCFVPHATQCYYLLDRHDPNTDSCSVGAREMLRTNSIVRAAMLVSFTLRATGHFMSQKASTDPP